MTAALLAAGAMVCTDICGAAMVLLESRERGWLAGFCDAVGWLVSITCTKIVVKSHGAGEVEALVLVTCANVVGTRLGVATGRWLLACFPATAKVAPRTDEPTTFYAASQSEAPMVLSASETKRMRKIQEAAESDTAAYMEACRAKAR